MDEHDFGSEFGVEQELPRAARWRTLSCSTPPSDSCASFACVETTRSASVLLPPIESAVVQTPQHTDSDECLHRRGATAAALTASVYERRMRSDDVSSREIGDPRLRQTQ